jgi:hypothetical protein
MTLKHNLECFKGVHPNINYSLWCDGYFYWIVLIFWM